MNGGIINVFYCFFNALLVNTLISYVEKFLETNSWSNKHT